MFRSVVLDANIFVCVNTLDTYSRLTCQSYCSFWFFSLGMYLSVCLGNIAVENVCLVDRTSMFLITLTSQGTPRLLFLLLLFQLAFTSLLQREVLLLFLSLGDSLDTVRSPRGLCAHGCTVYKHPPRIPRSRCITGECDISWVSSVSPQQSIFLHHF